LRERGLPELGIGLLQILHRAAIMDRPEKLDVLAQSHADEFGPFLAEVLHRRADLRVELRGFAQHGFVHLAHAREIRKGIVPDALNTLSLFDGVVMIGPLFCWSKKGRVERRHSITDQWQQYDAHCIVTENETP
jgi:hypothetical protein